MKYGQFKAQINQCWDILKKLEMDLEFISNPSYPKSPGAHFKGMSYPDVWKECLKNRYYHFQLFDNSLIYCSYQNTRSFSMSYYEFPYAADSYFEFIESSGFIYQKIGEELREQYDDYLTTCDYKRSVYPIRYDISYDQYVTARHPVSHLHIGHGNDIRIRTERIMEPVSFIYFLLRQFYPDKWTNHLQDEATKDKTVGKVLNNVRNSLSLIDPGYFVELDKCEIFLS